MAIFYEARIFRGQGCRQPFQNSSSHQIPRHIPPHNRRELSARRLGDHRDPEHAAGVACRAHLDRHNTVPGVEFRRSRFGCGGALWRSNGFDRDGAGHISRRDCAFRNRGADRDEAFIGTVPRQHKLARLEQLRKRGLSNQILLPPARTLNVEIECEDPHDIALRHQVAIFVSSRLDLDHASTAWLADRA